MLGVAKLAPGPGHVDLLERTPANCSVLGREADRLAARLPVLEPGEERVTTVDVRAEQRSP